MRSIWFSVDTLQRKSVTKSFRKLFSSLHTLSKVPMHYYTCSHHNTLHKLRPVMLPLADDHFTTPCCPLLLRPCWNYSSKTLFIVPYQHATQAEAGYAPPCMRPCTTPCCPFVLRPCWNRWSKPLVIALYWNLVLDVGRQKVCWKSLPTP